MRKVLYVLLAVLVTAPIASLASAASASAAIQRPAAANTVCDGHEEAWVFDETGSGGLGNAQFWYVSPHNVVNGAHSSMTPFCVLPEGKYSNNYVFAFRQEGTSNCATFDSNDGLVYMEGCNPSSITSQEWQITHPGSQYGAMWTLYQAERGQSDVLEGDGGDTPVYFAPSNGSGNQSWTIYCISAPASCTV